MTTEPTRQDWGYPEHPDDPEQHHCIVITGPASRESVLAVLSADEIDGMDGRSSWHWFRFPNGGLVLGVFPQGDTYFATEGDHSV